MSKNPMHKKGIFLVAVMRHTDKIICAYYSTGEYDKEGVRELVSSNGSAKLGMRYSVSGASQSVHYYLDSTGRIYAIVTDPKYPVRVAFGVLDELQKGFQKDFGGKVAGATEDSLSKPSRTLLKDIADRYADPAAGDQLVAVQAKIDVVKSEMQQNIQQLLINSEQMEKIATSAEELNEQSQAFKAGTKELRNKMFWKNIKMKLLIGGLIVAVLIIIIVPVALTAQGTQNASGNRL
eukprot:gene3605-7173_t